MTVPTKLELPLTDRRFKTQTAASEEKAKELRKAGFSCCTWSNGTACPGAGKIVTDDDGVQLVTCANHCTLVGRLQKPILMSAEDAAQCTRKTQHKTPYG